jgi:hypothetical protein
VVVCADGYRSTFRRLVDQASTPTCAGYALFRGDYPVRRLSRPVSDELERDVVMVCRRGGYGIFYLIPDGPADAVRSRVPSRRELEGLVAPCAGVVVGRTVRRLVVGRPPGGAAAMSRPRDCRSGLQLCRRWASESLMRTNVRFSGPGNCTCGPIVHAAARHPRECKWAVGRRHAGAWRAIFRGMCASRGQRSALLDRCAIRRPSCGLVAARRSPNRASARPGGPPTPGRHHCCEPSSRLPREGGGTDVPHFHRLGCPPGHAALEPERPVASSRPGHLAPIRPPQVSTRSRRRCGRPGPATGCGSGCSRRPARRGTGRGSRASAGTPRP